MFTHKDIEMRTIFVVNCIEHDRSLRVNSGELMLEEIEGDKKRTLTKFPFQKLLALFIIGHITVTTPLIDKCKKYGVALVVMKPNLRPVFFWANSAEANYLLRKRQFEYSTEDLSIAKCIVYNKVLNQKAALAKTRKKDSYTEDAIKQCDAALVTLPDVDEYNQLMGLEGTVAKTYFSAYYQNQNWRGRHPRMKSDVLNVTLDIGYSILFNFMESFIRMFGFDLYVGVYHRLWFKRKSLVCDLMEPFRCIIDHAALLAFNRKQFSEKNFTLIKQEYHLKYEKCADYYRVFYDELIARKMDIFKFVQQYYRCFMGCKSVKEYPIFEFSMIIVSYDISDDKMRTNFSKMLKSNGAIRLQFSVYEVRNTKRIVDNLVAKIEAYAKHFTADDSVILFDVDSDKLTKYGNAIHRDQAIVYF